MPASNLRTGSSRILPVIPALVWIAGFVVLPMLLMLAYSFWTYRDFAMVPELTVANYQAILDRPAYLKVLLRSVMIAGTITIFSILLAFPFAHALSFSSRKHTQLLLILVMVPYWTSSLIRAYSWMSILGQNGILNSSLIWAGAIDEPLQILYTPLAVVIAGIYVYVPYAIITLYSSLEKISPSLREAARDLGASPLQVFMRVILPLSMAGVQAAIIFIFIPAVGIVILPAVLGGTQGVMFGNLIIPIFKDAFNFAQGSAYSFTLLIIVVFFLALFSRALNLENLYAGGVGSSISRRNPDARMSSAETAYVIAMYIILFGPIVVLMIFSFDLNIAATFPLNGFTLKWYRELLADDLMLRSIRDSVFIASATSVVTVTVAAPAAYSIARFKFYGSNLIRYAVLIPMVLPSIMLAAAMLSLFAATGVRLSMITIIIGHVTYALPYAFLAILSQQYGVDRSVEEAARDLGANGFQVFIRVSLPLMLPGCAAAALLAFTLSLDEFNFSTLLTGDTTTLPMYVYSMLRGTASPTVNALGAIVTICAMVFIGISSIVRRRNQTSISDLG